jgi:hypothetical protein
VPIANCFVSDDLPLELGIDELTAFWSEESGVGSEHMTINLIAGTRQTGAPYRVMAFQRAAMLSVSVAEYDIADVRPLFGKGGA